MSYESQFQKATWEQLYRLLEIVEVTTQKRDWDWLLRWCDNAYDVDSEAYDAEYVITTFSDQGYWDRIGYYTR